MFWITKYESFELIKHLATVLIYELGLYQIYMCTKFGDNQNKTTISKGQSFSSENTANTPCTDTISLPQSQTQGYKLKYNKF